MRFYKPFFLILLCALFISSCKEKEKQGSLELFFTQTIDGQPIQFNQLLYTNSAENKYQVNEIKYFISKLILTDKKGESFEVKQNENIHYVDNSISSTLRWRLDNIPEGAYVSLSFVFGLDESDNKNNRFVNSPECNFSWPENLGGGYHYMQINGKFLNKENKNQNMNIHTGIGQLYNENNELTQFVHNYLSVEALPVSFSINADNTTHLTLNMEIQRWFDTPNLYNFDEFGNSIMQNQFAQKLLKENGWNVFDKMMR
jgi:hypothetical protein